MFDKWTLSQMRENLDRMESLTIKASAIPQHVWDGNATTATNPAAEPPGLTLEALEKALEAARPCVRYKATDHLPAHDVLGKPVFYGVDEALILFHPDNLPLAQAWAKAQGVALVEVAPHELTEARRLAVHPFKP